MWILGQRLIQWIGSVKEAMRGRGVREDLITRTEEIMR